MKEKEKRFEEPSRTVSVKAEGYGFAELFKNLKEGKGVAEVLSVRKRNDNEVRIRVRAKGAEAFLKEEITQKVEGIVVRDVDGHTRFSFTSRT